jgi:hypothetical protein
VEVPREVQVELIDVYCNDALKDKFREVDLVNFCKWLPVDHHLEIRSFPYGCVSVFATTYTCENIPE